MNNTFCIIAACDKNGLIGINNEMPWNLPEDLKYFKNKTIGKVIIMGRNTFESIGHPLKSRLNIVISSTLNKNIETDELHIVRNIDEAINLTNDFNNSDIFIIGGGEIYQQFLDIQKVDMIYLTIVQREYPKGDTYFPYQDIISTNKYGEWYLDSVTNTKKCQFCTYSKII